MRRPPSPFALCAVALLCAALLSTSTAAAEEAAQVSEPAQPQAENKKVTGEMLAIEAAGVQREHCADAYGRDTTQALKSIAAVGTVWARLSEQYERSGESFLLYWRGVLAQCMDQEARGLKDLKEFVAQSGDSSLWAALAKDAKRRIRQLERKLVVGAAAATAGRKASAPAGGKLPGIVLGASLAGGSLASGIAALDRWRRATDFGKELEDEEGEVSDLVDDGRYGAGAREETATQVLSGISAGLGVGAAVALIATAATGGSPRAAIAPPVLLPTHGGAAVLWELSW